MEARPGWGTAQAWGENRLMGVEMSPHQIAKEDQPSWPASFQKADVRKRSPTLSAAGESWR